MAEAFGERRTTGARDANLYPEGSVTGHVLEGATTGGTQEEAQGVVRNAPKWDGAPAHCAPAGEYKRAEPQPNNVPLCSPYCSASSEVFF
jgi:hypothetical protein